LSKLASKQAGTGKKQRAQPLHHRNGFSGFCLNLSPCITARAFLVFVRKGIRVVRESLAQPLRSLRLGERENTQSTE